MVLSMKLLSDATLSDVLPTLSGDKRVYVATVRHQMEKAQREYGPVHVRIGVTGNGSLPSFRIDRTGAPPIAFNANFHPFTDAELSEHAWSSRATTFADVDKLLKHIISIGSKSKS